MRPRSIEVFERLYLGSLVLSAAGTLLNWSNLRALPQVRAAEEQFGTWYLPFTVGIGLLIPVLLWYFIARRGSFVAKWIMVVFTGFGAAALAFRLMMGGGGSTGSMLVAIATTALNVVAASMLFKPDARLWFGEQIHDDPGEEDEVRS